MLLVCVAFQNVAGFMAKKLEKKSMKFRRFKHPWIQLSTNKCEQRFNQILI